MSIMPFVINELGVFEDQLSSFINDQTQFNVTLEQKNASFYFLIDKLDLFLRIPSVHVM